MVGLENSVDVWWGRLDGDDSRAAALLSDEERRRAGRMAEGAAQKFVGSRRLLREALARYVDRDPGELRFSTRCGHCGDATHGRPTLVGGGPEFSLSRTDGIAVVAVAERPVGVDVERRARIDDADGIAQLTLSAGELRALRGAPRPRHEASLLAAWTRKEAYLKGVGVGLANDPREVEFGRPDGAGWRRVHDRQGTSGESWWLRPLAPEGPARSEFVAALAVAPRRLAVRQMELP